MLLILNADITATRYIVDDGYEETKLLKKAKENDKKKPISKGKNKKAKNE